MPDISLHIPEDLKRRMDCEEGEDWSVVAILAFEKRLQELFQNRTITDMEAAIQRLRVSRSEIDHCVNAEGYEAGRRWAECAASFDQLKRLCEFTDQLHSGPTCGWGDFFSNEDHDGFSPSEILACFIQGSELDRELARDFWRSALERVTPPRPDFVREFAEGAGRIYHAVADRL